MAGIQGGLVKKEAFMDSSKVMVYCPSCEKATRVGHEVKDGKKIRVCKNAMNHWMYKFKSISIEICQTL